MMNDEFLMLNSNDYSLTTEDTMKARKIIYLSLRTSCKTFVNLMVKCIKNIIHFQSSI